MNPNTQPVRSPDIFHEPITPENIHEVRVGQIGTVRGKLEGVRFGGVDRMARVSRDLHIRGDVAKASSPGDPSLVIAFADWSMFVILIRDYHTAKAIPFPLGTYVCVKVQCVSEGAEVMALAMWEMGDNPVPVILGEPMGGTPTHYCAGAAP